MFYHFKIHKEKDGYWAQGIELPGCYTQGATLEELHENAKQALNLYIEEPSDSNDLAPLPSKTIKKTKNIIQIFIDKN